MRAGKDRVVYAGPRSRQTTSTPLVRTRRRPCEGITSRPWGSEAEGSQDVGRRERWRPGCSSSRRGLPRPSFLTRSATTRTRTRTGMSSTRRRSSPTPSPSGTRSCLDPIGQVRQRRRREQPRLLHLAGRQAGRGRPAACPEPRSREGGPWPRISDPSIAYDPEHDVWLFLGLGIDAGGSGHVLLVNRSTDGGLTWSNPVNAGESSGSFWDKTWITCDTWAASPHYGNCYIQFDDNGQGNAMKMVTSTDGGVTWGPVQMAAAPPGSAASPSCSRTATSSFRSRQTAERSTRSARPTEALPGVGARSSPA